MKVSCTVVENQIIAVCRAVVDTISGKALREGAKEYGKFMRDKIRAFIRKAVSQNATGTLAKHITFKIVTMKKKKTVVTIIGARTKVEVTKGKRKLVPSRYLHLFEKGHGVVRGRFAMQRAYKAFHPEAKKRAINKIMEVVNAEVKKRKSMGKKVFK